MGPIERELRAIPIGKGRCTALSPNMKTREVLWDAAKSLGLYDEMAFTFAYDDEIVSEAIEAAEALGL